ncbi:DNA polymerase III subunit delta [Pseudomarimonas salicorniae]|uniref:DNA polymerase III subunit delta n=1 Tax=Pseudomarimonas salicorniae TaxID=2933270 RepID=A0ABT0GMD6_9GAMM|nr:DNA polymerase III subunit delta [Lysobacter sp. CAU 1642]MCK7595182.1 DNA polymerase III subunit delta [Lysobacter sp. CAU 1642]
MPTGLAQLERQLEQGGALAPVYLLAGSEALLRLEAADAIRAAARSQGFSEREVFETDNRFDWGQLSAAASALSLFASRRLLDVRLPTGKPGKEGAQAISEYCSNPPPDLCLLISAEDWSKQHEGAWVRSVEKVGVFVPIWPLKPGELPNWVARRLKSRGVQAEPDAVAVLVERVEGNLLAAAQEVDKLALLAKGQRLDAAAMQSLVADSARFDVFGMTEAALRGDAPRALRMLRGLQGEGEAIVPLMNWVAGQVQLLNQLAEVEAAGGNVAAAMQAARVWDSRQPLYRKALSRLGLRGCQRLLAACAELDRASKGRSAHDPWLLIERVLAALSERRAQILLS